MKLFQRLLVAPAALGLMAPVAVNADTAFSSTTTLSGEAVFTVGAVDFENSDANEELYMQYAYSLDLDSSFSGSDNLHVGIEAGNASGPMAVLDSAVDGGANLTVSSLYYSFPVGDIAITGGPIVEADDLIGATASTYSEGLITQALPYSSFDWTGAGVSAAYAPENGITASASIISLDADDSTRGINNDNGDDIATLSVGFNGEGGFGGGIIYSTSDGDNTTENAGEYDSFGVGAYYNAEDLPLGVSVAYDTIDNESTGIESTSLHIGVDYEVGPGTAHVAYQAIEHDDSGNDTDQDIFELGYSYDVNDNVTVTPAFFSAGETTGDDQDTGFVVETTFSF